MRKLLTTAAIFLLATLPGTAQSSFAELGVGGGIAVYQGDIAPSFIGAVNRPGPSFHLMGKVVMSLALAVRGLYTYGYVEAHDADYSGMRQHRNFNFDASINELSAQLVYNPRRNNGDEEIGSLTPYLFGGVGIAFVSIKRDFSKFDYNFGFQKWVFAGLKIDSLKTLPTSIVTIPVGAGLRFQVGENVALYGELTKHFTRNEYLDGFSKSANQSRQDAFGNLIFGVVFRFADLVSRRGGFGCPTNVY